jgi:glycosyltransferase involved in cell wall biosynthesis
MAGGGAERGAVKLAEGLARRGYAVDLVLARAEGPRMAEIPDDVRLVDLGARRVLTSLPALIRYLRRERPAALASYLDHANIVALWARTLGRYQGRIIVVEQNTLSTAAHNGSTLRARLIPTLARRFFPWADFVVGVSEGVVADLVNVVGVPREKAHVIFNPIVTPDLAEQAAAPLDHPFYADGVPVFVGVGRLRPQKDFGLLIDAFALVRKQREARLVILGEGSERAELERHVASLGLGDVVGLPGAVTNPYAYMSRSAAFVLSSRWEGLPTVLIEAMACGTRVVATDCPSGPQEILQGGRFGALVPMGDAEALAAAMLAASSGSMPIPPPESWKPYEQAAVVASFEDLMTGAPGR